MVLLFSPMLFLEAIFLLLAILAFTLALRFFINSRRNLMASFPGLFRPQKWLSAGMSQGDFLVPKPAANPAFSLPFFQPTVSSDNTKEEIKFLHTQMQQQQLALQKAVEQIALLSQTEAKQENRSQFAEPKRLEQPKKIMEPIFRHDKDGLSQMLQERLEDVQTQFEELQAKMQKMESQAWEAAGLSLQLEHAEQTQLQLEKTVQKKEEKLRELMGEKQQLLDAFQELENRFAQANLHREQLQKKILFLEDINSDLRQTAEANSRLKTQITRVAELESMLHLLSEERKALARR